MKAGRLVDVFISKKSGPNRPEASGFVRFGSFDDVVGAIRQFNGFQVSGYKLKVTLAKFHKGGRPFVAMMKRGTHISRRAKPILNPAIRESRRYSEVVMVQKRRAAQSN